MSNSSSSQDSPLGYLVHYDQLDVEFWCHQELETSQVYRINFGILGRDPEPIIIPVRITESRAHHGMFMVSGKIYQSKLHAQRLSTALSGSGYFRFLSSYSNQRVADRREAKLMVEIERGKQSYYCVSQNFSLSGMQIVSSQPFPRNELLTFFIREPAIGGLEMKLQGKVIWEQEEEGRVVCGIQFQDLEEQAFTDLNRLLSTVEFV